MTQTGRSVPADERARPVASLVSSVSSQTAAMFPAFAVGSLALQMGDDLGFGEAGLGAAVAFFFLLAAVTSPHAGTLTDRLGPQLSLRAANVLSIVSLGGIAAAARSYWILLAGLAVRGDRADHRRAGDQDDGGPRRAGAPPRASPSASRPRPCRSRCSWPGWPCRPSGSRWAGAGPSSSPWWSP